MEKYRLQRLDNKDYFFEKYKATLLEDAEKLFNKSAKEWTEQIMTEYSIKIGHHNYLDLTRNDNNCTISLPIGYHFRQPYQITKPIHARERNVYL
jgi:hypothetical protein